MGYCKLTDFGLAKRLVGGSKTFTACGTLDYYAPEVVQQDAGSETKLGLTEAGNSQLSSGL